MKQIYRTLAVGTLALAGIATANASWRFGIKAGLNLDNLKISQARENFDPDNRCGWTAGVMTEFEVPVIGICADASLMYTRMENKFTFTNPEQGAATTPGEIVSNAGRNFIEIPVNLKWKLNIPLVASIIKPYIATGPAFAFKLGSNPYKDVIKAKSCQVAWNLGIGVELLKHLQIQGQYGFGINKVAELVTPVNTEDLKAKNNYWTVTAAYLF